MRAVPCFVLGTLLSCICAMQTGAFAASGDHMIATVGKPAVIILPQRGSIAAGAASATAPAPSGRPHRVIVSVSQFQPAADGDPVAVVVKAQKSGGEEREIGRFGITPHTPFKAEGSSGVQRFALPLPPDLAETGDFKLTVSLVPNRGGGKGAQLRVSGAELR